MTPTQLEALFNMEAVTTDAIRELIVEKYSLIPNDDWCIMGGPEFKRDSCLRILIRDHNMIHLDVHGPAYEILMGFYRPAKFLPVCSCEQMKFPNFKP